MINIANNSRQAKANDQMENLNLIIHWLRKDLKYQLIINSKDGSILVRVPAGEFEMGDGKRDDNPKHKVYLDTYYIGVYAVTNRQYKQFMLQTGHRAPIPDSGEPEWKSTTCPKPYIDHPVVGVSWEDAQAYCKWARLHLPTEAQWEKAARGPQNLLYPWGNQLEENKYWDWDPYLLDSDIPDKCEVYKYPAGASGHGTYNQFGNEIEWCEDWYNADYYKDSPSSNPVGPTRKRNTARVTRGGGLYQHARLNFLSYKISPTRRWSGNPRSRSNSTGFRCVVDPGRHAYLVTTRSLR